MLLDSSLLTRVDVQEEAIGGYRQPTGLEYPQMMRYGRDGSLSPMAFPSLSLRVDRTLG